MSGESNKTMDEPDLPYDQENMLKNKNDKNLVNETCGSTNDSENHVDKYLLDVKTYNGNDVHGDSQDMETINTDDSDKVSNNILSDLHNDDSNDGSLDGRQSLEIVANKSDLKHLNDLQSLSDTVNNFGDSQDSQVDYMDFQVETNDSDDISHISKQGSSVNGLESDYNSVDGLSEHDEDTVGDTMSSGETELERLRNDGNKLDNENHKIETLKIITIKRHHSDGENSSDYSDSELEAKVEDTVSNHSNSDDLATADNSFNNGDLNKSDEVIILENNGTENHNGTYKTSEINEIDNSDNDDCVLTAVEKFTIKTDSAVAAKKKKGPKTNNTKVELRRSSRTITRKKYDDMLQNLDDGSDIEEIVIEDPLKNTHKHIAINNTKTLEMTSKQLKPKSNQKKATTIVVDSPAASKSHLSPVNRSTSNALNKNIYQRITSRGTSVTPVTTKTTSTQATQVNMTTSVPILPTLTDEMFVVEAPSFIVPYVYEKPAVVPFKEFVAKWGKEIEVEKAKEEQTFLDKKKEEKAKREQENQERREKGENVIKSDEEMISDKIKKKVEKAERKERRRRQREDDDVSWDGSGSDESEDETISDEESQTTIKDKVDVIEETKDAGLAICPTTKPESYFDLSLGKFFMNIGLNLVQEYVQTDLLNQQNRKLQREKKAGQNTKHRQVSIALLTKNLKLSQKTNESLTFDQKKCKFCTFKTESVLAMAHHLETPHMKNNLYTCNYCPFVIKSPHDILYHMEKEHSVRGKLERTPALHQCANCPFEDYGKGKLARHLIACAKKFKLETNLAPPVEWEHPAKIAKVSRARNNAAPYHASQFVRRHVDGAMVSSMGIQNPYVLVRTPVHRMRAVPPPRSVLPAGNVPSRPAGLLIRHALPPTTYPVTNAKKQMNQSISITVMPRQCSPMQPFHAANTKGFVMCEICDGYIKDLEQLRNHMQWIHKVKIHPKMIYNRPPLNCQKCLFRFFTDQGLERHLLGSHGLVTSAIQEAANKGKDAGRCPVCGRVYQWKLLDHMSRDHNLVLKPAHLSYKCTVCTATFGMYRQFESHVYSAHSVVAKKVMDKKATASKANANHNAAKQLKSNDEITIIPQSVKAPGPAKRK